jgi:hypothetical protein
MIGRIITARITPAVNMSPPAGLPWNSAPMIGTLPIVAVRKGSTWWSNTGSITKTAHSP